MIESQAKVVSWYENQLGDYSNRLVDLVALAASRCNRAISQHSTTFSYKTFQVG